MTTHLEDQPPALVEAGPGWFRLTRDDPDGRFRAAATLWCPAENDELLEYMRIEVTNTSKRTLTLNPYAAIPVFARSADRLRDHRHLTTMLHRYQTHKHGMTVCPCMFFDERGHKINKARYTVLGFGPGGTAPRGIWTHQRDFLGEGGNYAAPEAVWKLLDPASGTTGVPPVDGKSTADRRDACPTQGDKVPEAGEAVGAFRFAAIRLKPGQTAEFLLVSGISDDPQSRRPLAAQRQQAKLRRPQPGRHVQILAGAPGLDLLPHGQLSLGQLACVGEPPADPAAHLRQLVHAGVDYGRGGKGWRDLWQDCLALLLSEPRPVGEMLLHNFGGIRIDGSNATVIGEKGNFIADRNNIPRTWMDHGVWPTLTTLLYVDQTGDLDILLARRPYYRDHLLFRCKKVDPDWTVARGTELTARSGKRYEGTVLEHMLVQTLTTFFNVGEHNLCRLEDADWNDGMDMAPHRGEAVAFSAFYAWNLRRIAEIVGAMASRGQAHIEIAAEMLALLDRLPGGKRVNYRSVAAKRKVLADYLATVAKGISGRTVKVPARALAADLLAKADDLANRIRTQEWLTPAQGPGAFQRLL